MNSFTDFHGVFAGVRDITTSIRSGKLKSLIDMRDSTLPDMQAQVDQLAKSLKEQVNQVHNRGTSYPNIVNNITGSRIFTDPAVFAEERDKAFSPSVLCGANPSSVSPFSLLDFTPL